MLDWLYEWIKNIAFYMIIVSVIFKVLPGNTYQKYIQFFSGIVLILLVFMPIVRIAGKEQTIEEFYQNHAYEQKKEEFELMEKYFTETDIFDFLPEEYMQEADQVQETENGEQIMIAPVTIGGS